jgi:hypothetical protein
MTSYTAICASYKARSSGEGNHACHTQQFVRHTQQSSVGSHAPTCTGGAQRVQWQIQDVYNGAVYYFIPAIGTGSVRLVVSLQASDVMLEAYACVVLCCVLEGAALVQA